jgi:hypothetical protein
MVFTQWEVMAWSFILRCLRQLSGGKSDTLSVHVCLCGIGDCTVSSVEGEEPPDAASQPICRPQGRISHKCIRDLEDFFGYTVLREDPSLLWSNISTCSARNPVRSSLCVPAVDLFFLFFFFLFAISLYQIHRARLVPRSFRLTGHELYAIPFLQQTIFFSL